MPYLIQKKADGSVDQKWELRDSPFTVGRGDMADAKVNDHEISREHFAIVPRAGAYAIKDLGSKNGTWLNGQRLVSEVDLKPNDHIRAGQTIFFYVTDKPTKGLRTVVNELEEEIQKSGKGFSTMRQELYKKA